MPDPASGAPPQTRRHDGPGPPPLAPADDRVAVAVDCHALDRRSDELAESILAPLEPEQREELVGAMRTPAAGS